MNDNFKWIDFLSKNNTLLINNETEFNQFKKFLQHLGLIGILKKDTEYYNWQHLAGINGKPTNYIIFEYDNYKGLTFGYTIKESKNWYEKAPLTIKDLELIQSISKDKQYNDRGR